MEERRHTQERGKKEISSVIVMFCIFIGGSYMGINIWKKDPVSCALKVHALYHTYAIPQSIIFKYI